MTANPCAVCGSETPDGTVCVAETEQARQQLAEIAETVEAARAVMYRQTSTSDSVHSTPGPRDLLDYGAGARLDAVQTALTGWVRAVAEDAKVKSAPREGDLIAACAEWLAERVELIRHLDYAAEILREIGDCWHAMRSVVATPAGRVYLGVCGAPVPQPAEGVPDLPCCVATTCEPHGGDCCHHGNPVECPADPYVGDIPCPGDVFGKPGKAAAYCQTCGAVYDQAERRVQVKLLVEGVPMRASVIAHAHGVSVDTIRSWAARGKITTWWVDGDQVVEWMEPEEGESVAHRGRRLYLADDVLALERQARQRREQRTAQATGMGA